ncbi:MAG TPA: diacylglycerol kinase family protein [Acidimicrobiales bacterium]|nr:diacylglycerol kinase family protein [Acidimicrobiales bacterium]
MRLMLVVNTSASSVTARARVVIQKALSADHEVVLKETNRRGHATRLAQGAAADGLDVVAVLGGDGTLNEAANGLAGSGTALAVLPGGSTNVFARTLGMANDPIEATSQLMSALSAGSIERVGLGQANARYFLFHAGIGFDAAVVGRVEKLAPLKRYLGPALFIVATLLTWADGRDRKGPQFTLEVRPGTDGAGEGPRGPGELDEGTFAIGMNTDPYTFLGSRPMNVAAGTSLATPLSLVVFDRMTLLTVVPALLSSFRGGLAGNSRHVKVQRCVHLATLRGRGPLPYQLDGDYVGEAEQIQLRWAAAALSLVLPLEAGQVRRPPASR